MTSESPSTLRISSWNVNGLRACARRGFRAWLRRSGASIVGVQEVRARQQQLVKTLRSPPGWSTHFTAAKRPGYSGTALYARLEPDAVDTSLGVRRFDVEGRLQLARFGRLVVANVYFPNGNGKQRDHGRVPFKLGFYRALFERLERLRRGGYRVLVLGDFNTARQEIDLARPRQNHETSGFLPRERRELDRWLAAGWVDTFRHFHPEGGHYTWWAQRSRCRERNVGWRIDYVLASPSAMRHVERAFIQKEVRGSDHCPIGVDVAPTIFGRAIPDIAQAQPAPRRRGGRSDGRAAPPP